ncbi:hypothetical protein HGRIS_003493 [Hohenbuehelia grisea]|uniref:DUF6534 domain-containing protein n=1 Tax=Hohenbuehelia grisea TaxID=104357 RepID=A0ABR3JFN2_9AGAR
MGIMGSQILAYHSSSRSERHRNKITVWCITLLEIFLSIAYALLVWGLFAVTAGDFKPVSQLDSVVPSIIITSAIVASISHGFGAWRMRQLGIRARYRILLGAISLGQIIASLIQAFGGSRATEGFMIGTSSLPRMVLLAVCDLQIAVTMVNLLRMGERSLWKHSFTLSGLHALFVPTFLLAFIAMMVELLVLIVGRLTDRNSMSWMILMPIETKLHSITAMALLNSRLSTQALLEPRGILSEAEAETLPTATTERPVSVVVANLSQISRANTLQGSDASYLVSSNAAPPVLRSMNTPPLQPSRPPSYPSGNAPTNNRSDSSGGTNLARVPTTSSVASSSTQPPSYPSSPFDDPPNLSTLQAAYVDLMSQRSGGDRQTLYMEGNSRETRLSPRSPAPSYHTNRGSRV